MDEHQLYAEQMKEWFKEHNRIAEQLVSTINHYDYLAKSNREQLRLHSKRTDLTKAWYNVWASEHGFEQV